MQKGMSLKAVPPNTCCRRTSRCARQGQLAKTRNLCSLSRCSASGHGPPSDEQWTFEIKFDGYRCIAVKRGNEITLFSRNEKVLNKRFPDVAQALASIGGDFVLDGELVAMDSQGKTFISCSARQSIAGSSDLFLRLRITTQKWKILLSPSIEHGLDQPLPAITACCSDHGGYTP
jgi:hypothetical protein